MEPQPLPDRVAALDRGVERADSRLVAVRQPPAHVHDDVAIPLVELLQHLVLLRLIHDRGEFPSNSAANPPRSWNTQFATRGAGAEWTGPAQVREHGADLSRRLAW